MSLPISLMLLSQSVMAAQADFKQHRKGNGSVPKGRTRKLGERYEFKERLSARSCSSTVMRSTEFLQLDYMYYPLLTCGTIREKLLEW